MALLRFTTLDVKQPTVEHPTTPYALTAHWLQVWKKTKVLDFVFKHNEVQNQAPGRTPGGTWLLPMGYPEGSPTHPAYPGGHSCFVAAAATIAKAFYQDTVLPLPKMVNPKDPAGMNPTCFRGKA